MTKTFAQAGAGAVEQGADGGFGFVHDLSDFGGFELLEGAQEQCLALGSGQAVDGLEGSAHLLGFVEGLVGGGGWGDEGSEEGLVGLIGAGATEAVESQVPGDADEPGAEVSDFWEFLSILQDAEEGVLDDVFGFGAVAEEAVGYAEEGGGVGVDERGEVHRGGGGVGGTRERQSEFLEHVAEPSTVTDAGDGFALGESIQVA